MDHGETSGNEASLKRRIEFFERRERELQAQLRGCHARLVSRDQELLEVARREARERAARIIAEDRLGDMNNLVKAMQSTRVWRLGHTWWQTRDAMRRALHRNTG